MIKNWSRRREGTLSRLGESVREVAAAWLVLFSVVAAGVSILGIYRASLADCTIMVSIPGVHHHFVANQEWDDPSCTVGICGNSQSAQEIDSNNTQPSGAASAVYSGSSVPVSGRANRPDQDERLC